MLPLCEELDTRLPLVEIFPQFLDEPFCIFLDSGMSPESLGRYSYVTAAPLAVLRSKADHFELQEGPKRRSGKGDPFRALQRQLRRRSLSLLPELPPFQGGWAGYFGYELGRHVEDLPRNTVDDLGLPDLYACLYDWALAQDHLTNRRWLFADGGPEGDPQQAHERLAWVKDKLGQCQAGDALERPAIGCHSTTPLTCSIDMQHMGGPLSIDANFSRDSYLRAVEKVKAYIAAGDTYQVNLSQRFDVPLPTDPWTLYKVLRKINPAPFAAYLQYPGLTVLSSSPEQFLKLGNGWVETRPIKGTRPRGATTELDRSLAQELVHSVKDRAENLMIVDLLRNDLGRVCKVGSVRVPELFLLEEYPTVFHLVSTVVGQLSQELDAVDLLRACFPGGSITGAPKIRAMQIIDELEPTERGLYCGSIGYLGHNGCMNTSIVIRTMVVSDGQVYFQVGGGIVADSSPEEEYQETLDKASALIMALQQAGTPYD